MNARPTSAPLISVVTPVYKTGGIVPDLVHRLHTTLAAVSEQYEIILVDDGSPDNAWAQLTTLCKGDTRVRAIRLSRNFGQHAAIAGGLAACQGEWVVVMDSDLQDSPEEIPLLYAEAQKGFDIVVAEREGRKGPFFRRLASRMFNFLLSWLSGIHSSHAIGNFGIFNRKVIQVVNGMEETYRSFPMMINWVGFSKTSMKCRHQPRAEGSSGYSAGRLIRLALDIVMAYSDKPLRYVVKLGFVITVMAFLFAIVTFFRYL
ncbi:MAG: glycosyltransferase family 2 protein, partial [Bacteroidetes bacterium]|nr:glycosyltransferase family 2 protein [Bacteroidota bacterium]